MISVLKNYTHRSEAQMSETSKLKLFNDYLYENEVKWADMVYLQQPIDGVWHEFTWKEVMRQARIMTTFLKSLGLQKGDKIASLSKNCAHWIITDFAISMAGFISVPLYAAQTPETIKHILEHSESKMIFVGKLDNPQLQEQGIPDHIIRVAMPYENPMEAHHHWNDILEKYSPDMENFVPDPKDLYTIMYTSGTTGNPKGVMISYESMGRVASLTPNLPKVKEVDHSHLISYLPLAHIFERSLLLQPSLSKETTLSFVESIATFGRDLEHIQPTLFQAAPRIWTQLQKGILSKLPQKKLDILLKIPFINTMIIKKIKAGLGFNRCIWFVSGSAPMSLSLLEWFKKLDIIICEGYGRTEDMAMGTIQSPEEVVFGTVGKFQVGVEGKLGENNELLTRSDMMMVGYFKDPEATKAAFTEDGFLRTGDEARIDDKGYLRILGRIRDTFKTDKGEFVNPLKIEDMFTKNLNIEQHCLIGMTLPQPIMLVVLSAMARHLPKAELEKSLRNTMEAINPSLAKYEKVSNIIICKEPWTPENELLTPTLKMKRNSIHAKYIDLAQKVSMGKDVIYWE